jgi:ketosteroid isomerase-like protein
MDPAEIRTRNRATLERSLAGVEKGDIDAQLEHCTDDLVMEFPYSDPPRRLEGKETVRAHLRQALSIFHIELQLLTVYECVDPDVLLAEYTSTGTVTTTNKPYANRYVGVVRFRDGLICEQREYYNPVPAARSLSPD